MKNVWFVLVLVCAQAHAFKVDAEYTEITCEITLRVRPCVQELALRGLASSLVPAPYTHPLIPLTKGSSNNWCGYVAAQNLNTPVVNSVTSVQALWIVPHVTAPAGGNPKDTYASIWIGIDGYNNSTVEQIGTSHEWHSGKVVNYAWFEMYPNAAFEISGFPLNPGDSIGATIISQGKGVFLMKLANNTRKVTTTIPTRYTICATAQCACAEWVVEAPYMKGVLPLAHFSNVAFSNCTATIGGVTGAINNPKWKHDSIIMKSPTMAPKATVSALAADGQSFSAMWLHS